MSTSTTSDITSPNPTTSTSTSGRRPSFLGPSPQPSLDDLKLSHILNGETCPPIAFADFATFIANKEFTSENLLFVIWLRSYRSRYDQLPIEKKTRIPVPSTRLGDRYTPFRYLDEASPRDSTKVDSPDALPEVIPPLSHHGSANTTFSTCDWAKEGSCGCSDTTHKHGSKSLLAKLGGAMQPIPIIRGHPTRPPIGTTFDKPEDQPMREEAVRAFATFLRKGGSRELGISDELREFAKTCLKRSTAPEVFEPIYEEVYQTLESQSLPHFLTYAKANVNRPKQMFWYLVGAVDFLIGVIIFLILTLLLSPRHFGYRAIRLPSTVFIWFGTAQMYSAYRGFCSQVWGRVSSQLKPWEMDEGDEEQLVDSPLPTPPITSTGGPISYKGAEIGHVQEIEPELEFGPEIKTADFSFPGEVYPLSDLAGSAHQADAFPWAQLKVDDDEMSEDALRRLAVRRDTIKVPDASLAFPIADNGPVTPPISPVRSVANRDISPFDFHASPTQPKSSVEVTTAQPSASGHESAVELGALLSHFERTTERQAKQGAKVKMFGPEKVVQDPRVKALYESIVRDILIVGSIMGVIWVGVCFAVPNYGLAQ